MSPATGAPSSCSMSERPSSRIPVPASRMMSHPSPVLSSTQGVLPPYRTVRGPGEGIEPRVPQNVSVRLIGLQSHPYLRPPLQRISVRDRDTTPLDANESLLLEVLHRSGDRLAARADHLRDRLVRERLVDGSVARLRGEVEQEPGYPSGNVEEDETSDLLVGATKPARQLGEECPSDAGVGLHAPPEVLPAEDEQLGVLHRDDVSGSRLIVDERELAEMRARLEHTEDHLPSILPDEHHFHPALAQDVERVARVSLEEDDAPLGIGALPCQLGELEQLVALEPAEHGNAGEEVCGLGSHWRQVAGNPFEGIRLTYPG